jgi:hypothetical protein
LLEPLLPDESPLEEPAAPEGLALAPPGEVFPAHSAGIADLSGYFAASHFASSLRWLLSAALAELEALPYVGEADGVVEAVPDDWVAVVAESVWALRSLPRSPSAMAEPLARAMRVVRIKAGAGLRI